MAETVLTKGVTLSVDKVGGETAAWTKILGITSIDGPNESMESLEKTDFDSTAKEFRSGLYDGGEITIEYFLLPTNAEHLWLQTQIKVGSTFSWQISIPTSPKATLITFSGFITECPPSFGAPGEQLTGSLGLKITGAVVWSVAA